MEQEQLRRVVESLLFITDQPLSAARLAQLSGVKDLEKIKSVLSQIKEDYQSRQSGVQIIEAAGGFQMGTRPEFSQWIRKLFHDRMTTRLSAAGLETLAIIAYRQPIARAEIEALRGVEVIASLETLLERRLIKVVGRKESVGRPLLYGTTQEFLRQFGLMSFDDLPKIEEIRAAAKEEAKGITIATEATEAFAVKCEEVVEAGSRPIPIDIRTGQSSQAGRNHNGSKTETEAKEAKEATEATEAKEITAATEATEERIHK